MTIISCPTPTRVNRVAQHEARGEAMPSGEDRIQEQPRDTTTPWRPDPGLLRSVRWAFPDSVRQRLLDSLKAGRARWSARGPHHYRLEVEMGTFWQAVYRENMPRWPEVEVRDGAIVRVLPAARPDTAVGLTSGLAMTVEDLFASAETELTDSTRTVSVLEIDPTYGFPRRVYSDTPGLFDVWTHIRVRRFIAVR
jgi:hypothetical protein